MNPLQRRMFDLVVLVLVEAGVYMVAFDVQGPLRWIPVVAGTFLLPGAAILSRMGVVDVSTFLGLTVAASVAVMVVAATLMVWLGWWHPEVLGLVVAVAGSGVLLVDVVGITRGVARPAPALAAPASSGWE
jgi:phosphatidylserine synthase